jgi:hypothetical protein
MKLYENEISSATSRVGNQCGERHACSRSIPNERADRPVPAGWRFKGRK